MQDGKGLQTGGILGNIILKLQILYIYGCVIFCKNFIANNRKLIINRDLIGKDNVEIKIPVKL